MKRGHVPVRTCRGCGVKAPQPELLRLVMRDGELIEDPLRRKTGRGVYICKTELCRTRLEKNKKLLQRCFRLKK